MAKTLKKELEECGCEMKPETFRKTVKTMHGHLFNGMTDERLLCNPHKALHLCGAVMGKAGMKLPDELILRTLLNVRKDERKRKA